MKTSEPGATTLDTDRLLLSKRQVEVNSDPFMYGYVDDYLDPDLYDDLNAHFPDERVSFVSNRERSVAKNLHPTWLPLLEFLASGEFLRDLDGCLGGILGSAPEERFFLRYMLSRMRSGEWLEPHTDNPIKIMTFILYFGSGDWNREYGGGTDIYEPKSRLLRRNPHSIEMPFEWMNRRETIEFVPNRLTFLVKSDNSWHGVAPIRCPESMTRDRLRFTLEYVDPVESDFEHGLWRFMRRRARRAIAKWMRLRACLESPFSTGSFWPPTSSA